MSVALSQAERHGLLHFAQQFTRRLFIIVGKKQARETLHYFGQHDYMPTPIKSVYWARVLETRIVSCSWSICRGNVVNSLSLAISERHTSRAFHTRVLNPPESIAVS